MLEVPKEIVEVGGDDLDDEDGEGGLDKDPDADGGDGEGEPEGKSLIFLCFTKRENLIYIFYTLAEEVVDEEANAQQTGPKKKLINQFNFCERAALTVSNTSKVNNKFTSNHSKLSNHNFLPDNGDPDDSPSAIHFWCECPAMGDLRRVLRGLFAAGKGP